MGILDGEQHKAKAGNSDCTDSSGSSVPPAQNLTPAQEEEIFYTGWAIKIAQTSTFKQAADADEDGFVRGWDAALAHARQQKA